MNKCKFKGYIRGRRYLTYIYIQHNIQILITEIRIPGIAVLFPNHNIKSILVSTGISFNTSTSKANRNGSPSFTFNGYGEKVSFGLPKCFSVGFLLQLVITLLSIKTKFSGNTQSNMSFIILTKIPKNLNLSINCELTRCYKIIRRHCAHRHHTQESAYLHTMHDENGLTLLLKATINLQSDDL